MADLQPVIFPPNEPTVIIEVQEQGSVIIQAPGNTSIIVPPVEGFTIVTGLSGSQGLAGESPEAFYDMTLFVPSMPSGGSAIFESLPLRPFSYPVALAGSRFFAETVATADAVFTLKKNSTSIGTITFQAGQHTPVISFVSVVSFTATDTLALEPPNPRDATLAGVTLNFAGSRS